MKLKPKTLQQQLVVFVFLPVAALLVAMGWAGFLYARHNLLKQWSEATTLKLQRAAHIIDMELNRPKNLIDLFNAAKSVGNGRHHIQDLILARLKRLEGIVKVQVIATNTGNAEYREKSGKTAFAPAMRPNSMHLKKTGTVIITAPTYDPSLEDRTVTLVSKIIEADGQVSGRIEAIMRFDHLVGTLAEAEWWQHQEAFLVDRNGKILASTETISAGKKPGPADQTAILPKTVIDPMASNESGTVFEGRFPVKRVSGYYRLKEAPWTLVITAPGYEVLAPMIRFRVMYLLFGAVFVASILLLIRLVTTRMVKSIREVSKAAERVAAGDYNIQLSKDGTDEIGELMSRFNLMSKQLEERAEIKASLHLAMEVQQNLLPGKGLTTAHLDIAGTSIFCDETGGDYYDFYRPETGGSGPLYAGVGDVTGHGVPAALLMATARALLRSRMARADSLSDMTADANRLLCADTVETGDFMTLFFIRFDPSGDRFTWVRAGHDPGLLYDPQTDVFTELKGQGLPLGIDKGQQYPEGQFDGWTTGKVVLLGTDGIWEARNPQGEMFGKDRLKQIVRENAGNPSEKILQSVIFANEAFRGYSSPKDDVTLVVIKRI